MQIRASTTSWQARTARTQSRTFETLPRRLVSVARKVSLAILVVHPQAGGKRCSAHTLLEHTTSFTLKRKNGFAFNLTHVEKRASETHEV